MQVLRQLVREWSGAVTSKTGSFWACCWTPPASATVIMEAGEGTSGVKMEKACDAAHITLNKNAVVGDSRAMNPGGVRIGPVQEPSELEASLHAALCVLFAQEEPYFGGTDAHVLSRLLCVSKGLRSAFLHTGQKSISGRLQLVAYPEGDPDRHVKMLDWLQHHLGCFHALHLDSCQEATSARAARILGDIAAATPSNLPHSICATSVGLVPSTLSRLPDGRLERLKLADVGDGLEDATLSELQLLTCLKELQLLWINPPAGSLAPALSALTSLTELFIRHPHKPEQQSLPPSLVELVVAQQLPPIDPRSSQARPKLAPLQLQHLTSLTRLEIREACPDAGAPDEDNVVGIAEDYVLPTSLQHLLVRRVTSALPLLLLTRLRRLDLTCMDHNANWQELHRLTTIKSLQQVTLPAERSVLPGQLQYMAAATSALHCECTSLVVSGSSWDAPALQALAGLSKLTHLILRGARRAGGTATLWHLASALPGMTGLRELHIADMDLPHSCDDQEAPVDSGWHAVMQAAETLPAQAYVHPWV